MKIYTKTGDDGTTGLFGSGRVPKHHPRIAAAGVVDELNSWLGLARAHQGAGAAEQAVLLERIQHHLFTIGAQIATPPTSAAYARLPKLAEADITFLENAIDRLTAELTELTGFILPGGTPAGATLQVARAVARRAERTVVAATAQRIAIDPLVLKYLNRLSDLLFTMARWANARAGIPEQPWQK